MKKYLNFESYLSILKGSVIKVAYLTIREFGRCRVFPVKNLRLVKEIVDFTSKLLSKPVSVVIAVKSFHLVKLKWLIRLICTYKRKHVFPNLIVLSVDFLSILPCFVFDAVRPFSKLRAYLNSSQFSVRNTDLFTTISTFQTPLNIHVIVLDNA